jgi:hypothetical protein
MRALATVVALLFFIACVGEDPDTTSSTSSTSSSGGGPDARSVQCDDTLCKTGEVCCLTLGTGSFVEKTECTPAAGCPTGTALVCDSTADCPSGQKCCVKTNGGSVKYGPSYCNTQCPSPDRQLCATADECATKSCAPPQSATTPTRLMQCAE